MAPYRPHTKVGEIPGSRRGRSTFSVAVVAFLLAAGTATAQAPPPEAVPFSEPARAEVRYTAPGTLEVELTAAPTETSILPGTETDVFAYNGQIPGPTIEAREGDRIVVHFRNDLPEPTTVHWHGLHIPISSDGSPLQLVQPGETFDYVLTIDSTRSLSSMPAGIGVHDSGEPGRRPQDPTKPLNEAARPTHPHWQVFQRVHGTSASSGV